MSGSDAFSSDMPDHGPPWGIYGPDPTGWDEDTADRILNGLSADDAPPGYVGAARILAAASAPASREELAGEGFAVTAFRVAALEFCPNRPSRSRSAAARLATPKAAAVAMALGLVINGGLAAAGTGSLPRPLQWAASEILREVGINVPGADTDVRRHHVARADLGPAIGNSSGPEAGGSGGPAANSGALPGALGADGKIGSSRVATSESNTFPSTQRVNPAGPASLSQANASSPVDPANPAGPPGVGQANASSKANGSSSANPAGPPGVGQANGSKANGSSSANPAGPPGVGQANGSNANGSSSVHPANPAGPPGVGQANASSTASASSSANPAEPSGLSQANASSKAIASSSANPAEPSGLSQANTSSKAIASSSANPAGPRS